MAVNDDISRIKNSLYRIANRGIETILEKKIAQINKNINKLQDQFFTILSQKIVGAKSAPDLGAFTPPPWKPLNPKYLMRKRRKGAGDGFFKFTGKLQRSLKQTKAVNAFGKPVAEITQGARSGGKFVTVRNGRAQSETGQFVAMKGLRVRPVITVDLYPRVTESIRDGRLNMSKYFTKQTAVKLTNWRGREDRPIIAYYMNWWLDVKARRVVTQALGGSGG